MLKNIIIPDKIKTDYKNELGRLFFIRINLFCYIAIFAFLLELSLAFVFFRNLISAKDMPGIIGGSLFAVILLVTGKFSSKLSFQKTRAYFFSFLLILISILAATAHPDIISYMGITLILLGFFITVLLLPWSFIDAVIIGLFTLINFMWVYLLADAFVNNQIFGINTVVLAFAVFIGAIVKKSEEVLRKKDFVSRMEIEEKNAIMAKELELANKIHSSLIPHSFKNEFLDIAVTYKPMLYMGGDYAKFHFVDKDRLIFILADVTGHGVSSALLVNRVHTEIERLLRENPMPGSLLKSLDEFINKDFGKMGFYLTAFCGYLDFPKKQLIYSNHGHPPQLLVQSKDNKIVFMDSQTFLMGIGLDAGGVYNTNVNFEKGDRLILFTDGIIEARNKSNELFGYQRLQAFARDNINLDTAQLNNKLVDEVDRFQSGLQSDDIFLLTIQTKQEK